MKAAHYPEHEVSRCNVAILFLALLTFPTSAAVAQWMGPDAPDSLSFQGVLTDTNGVIVSDGNYDLLFKMYKGSSKVWEENHLNVSVKSGGFDVILSGTTSYPLDTIAFNKAIDLGITVNGGTELTPRTPLTSAAYALGMRGMYAVFADDGRNTAANLIGGASNNYVAGGVVGATIGGGRGYNNQAGRAAKATHAGTFVWADSAGDNFIVPFVSTGDNQFLIRARGGVGIGTNNPQQQLDVGGGNIMVRGVDGFDAPGEEGIVFLGDAVLIKEDSGNVGIGTSSLVARLSVDQQNGTAASFYRIASDGTVVSIRQNGIEEGTISISGYTVS